MAQSTTQRAFVFLSTTLFFDIVRFPVWWYTTGVVRALRFLGRETILGLQNLSLPVLFKNLLQPMYGDYTKTGRIISFFLRIILFATRFVVFLLWMVLLLVFFFLWLALPPLTVYFFIRSLRA